MTIFHAIHIIVGAWLILVNIFEMFSPTGFFWNNVILGAIILVYNVYYLFARQNVDVKKV